jgi:outer membrane protein OmpA-like peptidoglycan-associated protein
MFAHTPAHAAKTRQPNAGSSDWAAREVEAARNAEQALRPNPNRLRATPLRAGEAANDDGLEAGAGRPLAPSQQELFETQFGQDFSQVRVHADAQAAQLADEASAKAFTKGRHIVFGAGQFKPGTPEGAALMAHELTHVAQQAAAGGGEGGATQRDPKPGAAGGVGASPPSEPVIIAKGVAPEDDFVLFDQDKADVSMASEKKLSKIFAAYTTPITVELHGYASREGDEEYNSNLSGHRAAQVKARILAMLPPGSQVTLYARGETQAFGPATSNRRVGVKVTQGVTVDTTKGAGEQGGGKTEEKPAVALGCPPDPDKPGILSMRDPDPSLLHPPPFRLLQKYQPCFTPPSTPVSPIFTLPPLRTPTLLDWSELRSPFTARGLRLSDRDGQIIEQNWWTTYRFLRGYLNLSPELAAWGANKGTAYAYDKMLSRESPNTADLFDQEWEKTQSILAPGRKDFRTPIVPILTPTTLEWLGKKVFKVDLKLSDIGLQ